MQTVSVRNQSVNIGNHLSAKKLNVSRKRMETKSVTVEKSGKHDLQVLGAGSKAPLASVD